MLYYLHSLLIIIIVFLIYKYRNKIRLNDVLLASIVVVIGCSLYKSRKVEGLCLEPTSGGDGTCHTHDTHDDVNIQSGAQQSQCPSPCSYVETSDGLGKIFRTGGYTLNGQVQSGMMTATLADFQSWASTTVGDGICVTRTIGREDAGAASNQLLGITTSEQQEDFNRIHAYKCGAADTTTTSTTRDECHNVRIQQLTEEHVAVSAEEQDAGDTTGLTLPAGTKVIVSGKVDDTGNWVWASLVTCAEGGLDAGCNSSNADGPHHWLPVAKLTDVSGAERLCSWIPNGTVIDPDDVYTAPSGGGDGDSGGGDGDDGDGGNNNDDDTAAELFKLEYSNDDSGLFTSVYDCVSATDTDSDKITCPDDKKSLNTSGKTDSKIGGTLLSWLFGKPSDTAAKNKCCSSTSTTSEPPSDDS